MNRLLYVLKILFEIIYFHLQKKIYSVFDLMQKPEVLTTFGG
jgi:hypothetical protein